MLRALLFVHLAVMLFGLAGLFGKLVATDAWVIVFGRTVFAAILLAPIAWWYRRNAPPNNRMRLILLALGMLLAVHWVTFFLAIQVSTVAIGLLTFASFPVFTLVLEHLFLGHRGSWKDAFLTLLVVVGLSLVVPDITWSSNVFQGAVWGVVSGFTFALLTLANRHYVQNTSVVSIALWQYLGASLCLAPLAGLKMMYLPPGELLLLVLLGVVFTALAHGLYVAGLKRVRAHTASLISTMEPVYGVTVAWALLSEVPSTNVLLGGALIMAAALGAGLAESSPAATRINPAK